MPEKSKRTKNMQHKKEGCVFTLVFVLVILMVLFAITDACPASCFCNTINKMAYCLEKGLTSIPKRIPKDTRVLNMNKNEFDIVTLKRHNFSDFKHLEQLYLSGCGIKAIEVGSFIDLINLKWLDLSKNRIKDVQDFTFRGLSLDQLFLDGNEGIKLHKDTFNGLKASGLYLHNCGLQEMNARILIPINDSLTNLWLNNNKLRLLRPELHLVFKSLTHLRLHGNPLHCNCRMKWMKRFFDTHNKMFDGSASPSCASPAHAHHRAFSALTIDDFRCQPPIFNDVDLLFSNENGILSCTASGDPAPTLIWVKPNGERKIYFPSYGEDTAKTDAVMRITHSEDFYTGGYECLATNDGGNVTLTLNVSWPKIEKTTVIRYVDRYPKQEKPPAPTALDETVESDDYDGSEVLTKNRDRGAFKKSFTILELASAVIGTFVATLLLCLLVFRIILKVRANQVPRNRLDNAYAVTPACAKARDNMYLNNRAEDEDLYMGINDLGLPPR